MLGRTHMLGGLVAWEAVQPLVSAPLPIRLVGAAFAVWGSLGPDMDHQHSTWSRSFNGGPWLAKRLARFVGGHRQGTHSLLSIPISGLIVLGLMLVATVPPGWAAVLAAAWTTGWTSHIAEDMLTVQGVGLLYPFNRVRISAGNLRTSQNRNHLNAGEHAVVILLTITGVLLALSMLGGFIEQTGRPTAVDHSVGAASTHGPLLSQP